MVWSAIGVSSILSFTLGKYTSSQFFDDDTGRYLEHIQLFVNEDIQPVFLRITIENQKTKESSQTYYRWSWQKTSIPPLATVDITKETFSKRYESHKGRHGILAKFHYQIVEDSNFSGMVADITDTSDGFIKSNVSDQ